HHSDNPSLQGRCIEGPVINGRKGRPYIFNVDTDHYQGRDYIDSRHQGNHTTGYFSDTFDSPNYNGTHESGQGQPKIKTIPFHEPELAGQNLKGLVGLKHIAPSQGCPNTKNRKEYRQYFSQSSKVS